MAFAGLYCPKLALIEFSVPFLPILAKKYFKMNPMHYSNIEINFWMKIWTLDQCDEGKKLFECDVCTQNFTTKPGLSEHIVAVH